MASHSDVPVAKLILWPALITLAVTVLRLVGELLDWSPRFFSREPGGGAAVVGIAWLAPVFGAVFALQLARSGRGPASLGRAFGFSLLALLLLPAAMFAAAAVGLITPGSFSMTALALSSLVALAAVALAPRAWPELAHVLTVYGFAARVPVAVVMLLAMLGGWGTHYDAVPPGSAPMSVIAKWLLIGVLPQLTVWMWWTVALGLLTGCLTYAAVGRRAAA